MEEDTKQLLIICGGPLAALTIVFVVGAIVEAIRGCA
jgi:hypothetical protein